MGPPPGAAEALLDSMRNAPMPVIIGVIHGLLAERGLLGSRVERNAALLSGSTSEWRPVGLAAAHALLSRCLSADDGPPLEARTEPSVSAEPSAEPQLVRLVHSVPPALAASSSPSTKTVRLSLPNHLPQPPDTPTFANLPSQGSNIFNMNVSETALALNAQVEADEKTELKQAREDLKELLHQTYGEPSAVEASPVRAESFKPSLRKSTSLALGVKRWSRRASVRVSAMDARKVAASQIAQERWHWAIGKVRESVRDDVRARLKQEKILNPRYNLLSVLLEERRKSQLAGLVNMEAEKEYNNRMQLETPLHPWQVHPESSVIQLWDACLTVALVWTLLAVPFRIAFEPQYFECESSLGSLHECSWGFMVDLTVNLMFILDVLVVFCTGVWVTQEVKKIVETEEQSIFHHAKLEMLVAKYTSRLFPTDGTRHLMPASWQTTLQSMKAYISDAANKRASAGADEDDMEDIDPAQNPYSDAGMKKSKEVLSYGNLTIASKYMKGYLVVDVLSCVPWEMVLAGSDSTGGVASSARALKLVRLVRMLRLLRMHKATKVLSKLAKLLPMTLSQLLALSLYAVLLVHYLACGFFLIATTYERAGQQTWLSSYENWDKQFASDDMFVQDNLLQLYILSFYWGFTTITTVGYGDIVPYTDAERMYSIFAMYCGIALMSIITGKLTTILAQFVAQRAQMQMQLRMVHQYCNYRNLPPDLKRSVKDFFAVRAAQRAMCNEDEILNELSPPMKAKVVCFIFRDVIESVPFFRGSDDLFLSAILSSMTPILFSPSDTIIQKGQLESAMYVIGKGCAAALDKSNRVMKHLHPGDFVGEIALFFNTRRSATVLALVFCDTFRMSHEQLVSTLTQFPDAQERLAQQAEILFVRHIRCYLCNKTGHISIGCRNPLKLSHSLGKDATDSQTRRRSMKQWFTGSSRNSIAEGNESESSEPPTAGPLPVPAEPRGEPTLASAPESPPGEVQQRAEEALVNVNTWTSPAPEWLKSLEHTRSSHSPSRAALSPGRLHSG